jgi:hypothetical protein
MGTSLPILRSLCTNKVQITKTWHALSAVTLPLTLKWHAQSYLANVASAELAETLPRCCHQGPVNKASSDWPRRLPQQYHPTPVFGRCRSGRLSSCCLRLFLVFLGLSRQMPGWYFSSATIVSFQILSNSSRKEDRTQNHRNTERSVVSVVSSYRLASKYRNADSGTLQQSGQSQLCPAVYRGFDAVA